MAGHSKWKQIKRKKAVTDQKRGAMFTRLIREITIAAKAGGGDPGGNARLRTAIDAAKAENMPADNIDRAIKKGTGELEGESYEEITYEGFGPAGVAVLVEVATDNRNRTTPEIRHLFTKHGGAMAEAGSVAWMFKRRGYFAIDPAGMTEEQLMELALELGVDDITVEEDRYEMLTAPEEFTAVQEALESRGVAVAAKELAMMPQTTVDVPADRINQVFRLMEALEDHDDAQKVWANFNVDEKVLAAAQAR